MTTPITLAAASTPSAPALLLRPWCAEDVPALVAAHRDPELRRRLLTSIDGEDDGLAWVRIQEREWAAGARFAFAVLEAGFDGVPPRLVGHVAVKEIASGMPSAEVRYWTAAHARGRGVAPRALKALTAWSFATFRAQGLERLELLHQVDNTGSCRVAAQCGYALDRILPSSPPAYPRDGHVHVRRAAA